MRVGKGSSMDLPLSYPPTPWIRPHTPCAPLRWARLCAYPSYPPTPKAMLLPYPTPHVNEVHSITQGAADARRQAGLAAAKLLGLTRYVYTYIHTYILYTYMYIYIYIYT